MKIEDIKRRTRKEVVCSVRITKEQKEYLDSNDISLTRLLSFTIDELMEKEK